MPQYLSADWIYPVNQPPLKNGVVAVNDDGEIIRLFTSAEAVSLAAGEIKKYSGAIVPGFVNTHCHLELSHLRDKLPERTGLVDFVKNILKLRNTAEEDIIAAATRADKEMYENGIVAVGDISNNAVTVPVKQQSALYYHTFIELLGFNPAHADTVFSGGIGLKEKHEGLSTSIVPHAPYSVSPALFAKIAGIESDNLTSIHNQETIAENTFFESGKGDFIDFYKFLGVELGELPATGKNALQTYLPAMAKNQRTLLVHNTFTSRADVDFALQQHNKLFFCLCPNANLFIENRLPDVAMLNAANITITLGTDSLASNHLLNILDEMITLQLEIGVDFEDLLKWGTINGAKFLGLEDSLGTIEPGKKPGLNLVQLDKEQIVSNKVKRLI